MKVRTANRITLYLEEITILFCMVSLLGCATTDVYQTPRSSKGYAAIEETGPGGFFHDYVGGTHIRSVNRKPTSAKSYEVPAGVLEELNLPEEDSPPTIILVAGLNRLEVQACEYSPNLFGDILLGILTLPAYSPAYEPFFCGTAVLRLEAQSGVRYRVQGKVDKKKDYADLWIENAETQKEVIRKVRVTKLKHSHTRGNK